MNIRQIDGSDWSREQNIAGHNYFKQDLQLHKTWQSANWQCNNCTFYNSHLNFTTAEIVINCTLKYAFEFSVGQL